jgi:hypothetical protein
MSKGQIIGESVFIKRRLNIFDNWFDGKHSVENLTNPWKVLVSQKFEKIEDARFQIEKKKKLKLNQSIIVDFVV